MQNEGFRAPTFQPLWAETSYTSEKAEGFLGSNGSQFEPNRAPPKDFLDQNPEPKNFLGNLLKDFLTLLPGAARPARSARGRHRPGTADIIRSFGSLERMISRVPGEGGARHAAARRRGGQRAAAAEGEGGGGGFVHS